MQFFSLSFFLSLAHLINHEEFITQRTNCNRFIFFPSLFSFSSFFVVLLFFFLRGRLRLHINSSRFFVSIFKEYLVLWLFDELCLKFVLFFCCLEMYSFIRFQFWLVLILMITKTQNITTKNTTMKKKKKRVKNMTTGYIIWAVRVLFHIRLLWHLYWPYFERDWNAIMIDLFGSLIAENIE